MRSPLAQIERPDVADIPANPSDFLRAIGRPTMIRISGRDPSRVRIVTTLLHGNEPSGFRAIHAWLRSGDVSATDVRLVIVNVEAATAAPGFAHRMLPGRRDLNRCFLGPWDDAEGRLARAILEEIERAAPEALIDIHNNTGHNPPYGVGVDASHEALQLVARFGDHFVWSQLRLGALMEALPGIVSATVEVGRSGDLAADIVALDGLRSFLADDIVLEPGVIPPIQLLVEPMRACVRPGVLLRIADSPDPIASLTVKEDFDRHNFTTIATGTVLGWTGRGEQPLTLFDADGRDRASEFFVNRDGELITLKPMIPIMITMDIAIATNDCLFYVVREA